MADELAIAGMQQAANLANMGMQIAQNKKQLAFQKEMYERQRQDALADWTMQNQYNHPSAQMKRLQEAGLNPNLAYGTGVVANNSAGVRSSSVGSWNPTAPRLDTSALANYYDYRMKTAQTNNLAKQNQLLDEEMNKKLAEIKQLQASTAETLARIPTYGTSVARTQAETKQTELKTQLMNSLMPYDLQMAEQRLRGEQMKNEFIPTQQQMEIARNSANFQSMMQGLKESAVRILKMQAETANTEEQKNVIKQNLKNLELDFNSKETQNKIQQMDLHLKHIGVNPGDNIMFRRAAEMFDDMGKGLGRLIRGY